MVGIKLDYIYSVFVIIIMLFNYRVNPEGISNFAGWARMALPITTFSIVEVSSREWLYNSKQ